jgi:hypothetical protein
MSLGMMVESAWKNHAGNGATLLSVLDKCINNLAKSNDWDQLSRFIVASDKHGGRAKVNKVVRAAFGNDVTFKSALTGAQKHPTGGRITLSATWPKEGGYVLKNTYGTVRKAIKDGVSWDDKMFLKGLEETLLKPERAPIKVSETTTKQKVSALTKFLVAARKDGFNVGDLIREAQAEIALNNGVVKSVVNGIEVVEINH